MTPAIGKPAPPFRLPTTEGGEVALSDLKGKRVLLFFYPKDNTPGCTTEACDLRDRYADLRKRGVVVLGISKDSLASHEKFRAKHELPFPLLTDADSAVARAYGAFGEKVLYGRKHLGTIRSTFAIDDKGVVRAVWSPVKVAGHADAVVAFFTA